MWRLVLLVELSACSLYSRPDAVPVVELAQQKQIAGDGPVTGIESDGNGGLWIVYDQQIREWGQPADVWIDHIDAWGTKLAHWVYPDEYIWAGGIAVAGDTVWLGYATDQYRHPTSNAVRVLDAATGAERGSFPTRDFVDLAFRHGDLLVSDIFNEVVAVNPLTGAERWSYPGPAFTQSTQAGIASADGNIWLSTWTDGAEAALPARFAVLDDTGAMVATGHSPMFGFQSSAAEADGMQLAWDGGQLVVQWRNTITWFELQ